MDNVVLSSKEEVDVAREFYNSVTMPCRGDIVHSESHNVCSKQRLQSASLNHLEGPPKLRANLTTTIPFAPGICYGYYLTHVASLRLQPLLLSPSCLLCVPICV